MADSKVENNVQKKNDDVMQGLKGLFPLRGFTLVQKKVNEIRDKDTQAVTGHYCDIAFSNGSDGLIQLTCGYNPEGGAIGNGLEVFKKYDLGCDIRDKKVKVVDYRLSI